MPIIPIEIMAVIDLIAMFGLLMFVAAIFHYIRAQYWMRDYKIHGILAAHEMYHQNRKWSLQFTLIGLVIAIFVAWAHCQWTF